MIVLDASAAVEWLLQSSAGQRIESRIYSRNESLHAPHLLDVEVSQVLRPSRLKQPVALLDPRLLLFVLGAGGSLPTFRTQSGQ